MANEETGPRLFPAAMLNVTNRCNLRCRHCFVFREGNPNDRRGEMSDEALLAKIAELKERHGIEIMLWMGGEPLLKPEVLRQGTRLFQRNHVTTNGTLDLIELPRTIYVISIDGPPEINDAIRGKGTFDKVMKTLCRVPESFGSTVMCQCVVTRKNEHAMQELVERLRESRIEGMTFSFYVPRAEDVSDLTWGSLADRDPAVREALRLKDEYPDFIWNNRRSLQLTLSENAKAITDDCPATKYVLPLYLEGDELVTPYCCYGNDVDCDLCGAWVVFYLAAKLEPGRSADGGPAW